jgi:hypothetical protein
MWTTSYLLLGNNTTLRNTYKIYFFGLYRLCRSYLYIIGLRLLSADGSTMTLSVEAQV